MAAWLEKSGPFTVFDLETTGMSPVRCRIIEIGAVRIEKDGSVTKFESFVNPGEPIPPQISALTGITDEMVASAPPFHDIGYNLLKFFEGSRLVAHNARFDLGFLMQSLARSALPLWQGGAYDSVTLARKAYPGMPSYSLSSLRQAFQLGDSTPGRAHRALYDAEVTLELLQIVMKKLSGGEHGA